MMNCAEKAKEIISTLDGRNHLFTIVPEIQDNWDADHAVFEITLVEEDYRDLSRLEYDLIKEIKEIVGEDIPEKYGSDEPDPDSDYVLNIYWKRGGLTFETELRRCVKS